MTTTLERSFGQAARVYDRHARVQSAMADWLEEWLPEERRGRALEVGAGSGLFTRRLVPWGEGSLTATDLSMGMCAEGARAVPGAHWRVMAAERPLAGPWNWIFTSSMLQWVEDPVAVFEAWKATLAPGGRVVAGLYAAGSLTELAELTGGWWPVRWRTPAAWRDALRAAGLRLLRDDAETRGVTYASAVEFLKTLHGVGAAPERRVEPARLRAWLRAQGDGEFVARWTFYRFEAERARD